MRKRKTFFGERNEIFIRNIKKETVSFTSVRRFETGVEGFRGVEGIAALIATVVRTLK